MWSTLSCENAAPQEELRCWQSLRWASVSAAVSFGATIMKVFLDQYRYVAEKLQRIATLISACLLARILPSAKCFGVCQAAVSS